MAQPPPTSIMYIFTCLFSQHYGRSQLVMYGKFCNHFRWMTTFGVIPIEDALAFCMHFATCDHCFLRVAATLCLDRQDATTNLHSTVCTMSPLIDRQEEIARAPQCPVDSYKCQPLVDGKRSFRYNSYEPLPWPCGYMPSSQ